MVLYKYNMSMKRRSHTATVLANDKLLVIGGFDDANYKADTEL